MATTTTAPSTTLRWTPCLRPLSASQTLEEQVANAKAADEYVAQQHYTIQCGPCEKVNSYIQPDWRLLRRSGSGRTERPPF